jgi:glycosyltransferase involved in cell wall biosynthesis
VRIGIISLIDWDFLEQRPQKFAHELAARGHSVYYVEPTPFSHWSPFFTLFHWFQSARTRSVAPGIFAFPGLMIAPRRDQASFLSLNRYFVPWMIRRLRTLRLDFIIVLAVEYAPVLIKLGVPFAYDHVDDTQFMEHVLTEEFVERMEALKARSEFNIYIHELEAARDPKGVFVCNGADPSQFFPIEAPKAFDAISLSNIAKWFDMDSVLESRKKILLVGPMDIGGGNNRERFFAASRPNLIWIPEVDKQVANMWFARAKVGLVLRKPEDPVSQYAMPIKILEYFLAGLPVVTYRNEGITRMYGDMVTYYARDGSDIPLDEAIEVAQTKQRDYRRFALDFNWTDIAGRLERRIWQVVDPKRAPPPTHRMVTEPLSKPESSPFLIPASAIKAPNKEAFPPPRSSLQIVYVGATDWGFIRQRPQQLALQFSRHHNVLYVCQRSPLAYILRRQPPPPQFLLVNDNLKVLHPRVLGLISRLHRYAPIRALNQRLIRRAVQPHLKDGRADVLWLGSPWDYGYHKLIEASVACYDCMDNWPAVRPTWNVAAIEEDLFRAVDIVFASSKGLHQKAKASAPQAFLIPNGADFDHFAQAITEPLPAPSSLGGIPRPRIGFYGAIGFWVDLELMQHVAQVRPHWSFVLLGPHLVPVSETDELRRLPNVYFLGPRDYTELPAYLQHVDLWWSPFRVSELTRDVDPVKVYEQLAAGKRVVVTRLPEMEKFLPLIELASGADEFLTKMEAALAQETDEDEVFARVRFASENTWEHRIGRIMEVMAAALERK